MEKFGNWPLLNGGNFEGDWVKILTEILRTAPENVSPFLLKLDAAAVNDDQIVLQVSKLDQVSTEHHSKNNHQ